MNKNKQNIIALVYDFDGTLSPWNMQEETIFKAYEINKDLFWAESEKLEKERGYEKTLAYLKLLIDAPVFRPRPISQKKLRESAKNISYFPGVNDGYFERLDDFVHSLPDAIDAEITLEHYIVSSGLRDILDGVSIRKYFKAVFGCEFDYDDKGHPLFPKLVINDTNKTQFLFRINKGKLDLSESVNDHMPESERRIPFRNMIYIGDGITDVPSMTVTQKAGGYAVAVYSPEKEVPKDVRKMVADKRAEHFAPADFRDGKLLVKILRKTIRRIIAEIVYRNSAEMSQDWVKLHR